MGFLGNVKSNGWYLKFLSDCLWENFIMVYFASKVTKKGVFWSFIKLDIFITIKGLGVFYCSNTDKLLLSF